MTMIEFAGAVMSKFGLYPNQTGHTYIKDQLINALDINNTKALIGDANLDGKISILDATTIQRHLAQLAPMSDEQLKLADVNASGDVTIVDATMIQLYLAHKISKF